MSAKKESSEVQERVNDFFCILAYTSKIFFKTKQLSILLTMLCIFLILLRFFLQPKFFKLKKQLSFILIEDI